nr:hypothetical protein [uncultured Rhodoferax sp.]
MGIQVIVKAEAASDIESALGHIASECEIFPINTAEYGVSIPGKVFDAIGTQHVEAALKRFDHFDLWAGVWKPAKQK